MIGAVHEKLTNTRGESHQEDRNHTRGAGSLVVYRISPTVRQFDFEPTEEREGENGKQEEEDDVETALVLSAFRVLGPAMAVTARPKTR